MSSNLTVFPSGIRRSLSALFGAPLPEAFLLEWHVERHVGRYERAGARYEVFVRDASATLRITPTGPLSDLPDKTVRELIMAPLDGGGDLFAVREPPARRWTPVTFFELPDGARYMSMGGRATPKVA